MDARATAKALQTEGPVMRAYEPSWRDRIASALMGNGKASPERARFVEGMVGSRGLGNTGVSAIDATPAGGVLGMQEAAKSGDKVSFGLNAAGTLPGGGLTHALFLGPMSATANKAALRSAELLNKYGASADTILDNTKWAQGADKNWRYEISDHAADLHPWAVDALKAGKIVGGRMQDVFNHPDLYRAYPHLADMPVSIEHGHWVSPNGEYNPKNKFINVSTDTLEGANSPKSILLHEIQHAIQHHEGFANGGSPKAFTQQGDATFARDILQVRKEVERELAGNASHAGDFNSGLNSVLDEYKKIDATDWFPDERAQSYASDYGTNPSDQLLELVNIYGLDRRTTPYTGRQVYDRLAGENEAGAVQKRMNLLPQERMSKNFRPWDSYQYPISEQVVQKPLK